MANEWLDSKLTLSSYVPSTSQKKEERGKKQRAEKWKMGERRHLISGLEAYVKLNPPAYL
jgi:hypothetical protein